MHTPFPGKQPCTSTLDITLVAVVSGLLLRLSYPPSGVPFLVFLALVPLLGVTQVLSASDRFYAGFVVGILAHADFTGAFIAWGYRLTFLPVFAMGILFGVLSLCTGVLQKRLPILLRWSAMACLWPWVSLVGEILLGIPLSLSAAFALTESRILVPVSVIGALSFDVFILTISGVIAGRISHELPLRHAMCVFVVLSVVVFASALYTENIETGQAQIPVALVQPALNIAHQQRAKWSLAERNTREMTVDELTSQAIASGAKLIVWPEGGNGLSNKRLLRRQEKFSEFTVDTGVTLIASGTDVTPDGKEFNIVHQIESGLIVADAMKSRPVAFSEDALV